MDNDEYECVCDWLRLEWLPVEIHPQPSSHVIATDIVGITKNRRTLNAAASHERTSFKDSQTVRYWQDRSW